MNKMINMGKKNLTNIYLVLLSNPVNLTRKKERKKKTIYIFNIKQKKHNTSEVP